jgi:hypothetical protein
MVVFVVLMARSRGYSSANKVVVVIVVARSRGYSSANKVVIVIVVFWMGRGDRTADKVVIVIVVARSRGYSSANKVVIVIVVFWMGRACAADEVGVFDAVVFVVRFNWALNATNEVDVAPPDEPVTGRNRGSLEEQRYSE